MNDMEPDMMATAVSKLPPPSLQQSRQEDLGGNMSYDSIREDINRQQKERFEAPRAPPPAMMEPEYQPQYYQPQPQQMVPPFVQQIPPPTKSVLSTDTLKNKKVWLLAAMILCTVLYVIPKTKQVFPSLVSPLTGRLSTPAIAGVSLLTSLAYTAVSDIV